MKAYLHLFSIKFHPVARAPKGNRISLPDHNVFSIGVDYGTSVLTLCFLSHLRVHYCYVILVKYA